MARCTLPDCYWHPNGEVCASHPDARGVDQDGRVFECDHCGVEFVPDHLQDDTRVREVPFR